MNHAGDSPDNHLRSNRKILVGASVTFRHHPPDAIRVTVPAHQTMADEGVPQPGGDKIPESELFGSDRLEPQERSGSQGRDHAVRVDPEAILALPEQKIRNREVLRNPTSAYDDGPRADQRCSSVKNKAHEAPTPSHPSHLRRPI